MFKWNVHDSLNSQTFPAPDRTFPLAPPSSPSSQSEHEGDCWGLLKVQTFPPLRWCAERIAPSNHFVLPLLSPCKVSTVKTQNLRKWLVLIFTDLHLIQWTFPNVTVVKVNTWRSINCRRSNWRCAHICGSAIYFAILRNVAMIGLNK